MTRHIFHKINDEYDIHSTAKRKVGGKGKGGEHDPGGTATMHRHYQTEV